MPPPPTPHTPNPAYSPTPPPTYVDTSRAPIKEDVLRLIAQYLADEGYTSAALVLQDEGALRRTERAARRVDEERLLRAIADGAWADVETLAARPLVATQNALLYAVYREQFLELVEHRELQKAFALLHKRLKPLEHFQPTPDEFRDLCYLLTAKSVHEARSFRGWGGVAAGRAELARTVRRMLRSDDARELGAAAVPPRRLERLLEQAVAHQVGRSRFLPRDVRVETLLRDYTPSVVPNALCDVYSGHTGHVKSAVVVGGAVVSGGSDGSVRVWWGASGGPGGPAPSEGAPRAHARPAPAPRGMRGILSATQPPQAHQTPQAQQPPQTSSQLAALSPPPGDLLTGHTGTVWSVQGDATQRHLASASGDGTVKVWDLARGQCTATLAASAGDVYAATWSPQAATIASGGYDRIVRLHDVESETLLKTFTGHSLSISSVLFNPTGNLIVSGSKDSTIRFWDSLSGLCVRTLSVQLGEVTSVDMRDNYLLTSSRSTTIRLWDIRMLRPLRKFKAHSNFSHNFVRASFAQSTLIVTGSEDGRLYIWDRESEDVLHVLDGHNGVAYGATYDNAQSLLVSYGSDALVKTWTYDQNRGYD